MDAKFMNRNSGSDTYPYEIVEVVSAKKVMIRPMNTVMADDWQPEMVAGGYSAHCTNSDSQRWVITPCHTAEPFAVTQRKDGKWYAEGGAKGMDYTPSVEPIKFYDFNF